MTTPTLDTEFPLKFSLPEGFTDMDLTSSARERADHLLDTVERALPDLSGEQRLRLVFANQMVVEQMLDAGVLYASNFVGRSEVDPTAASTAQLSVLVLDELGESPRPLDVLAEALRSGDERREVQLVDLAIGRCLAVVEETVLHPANDLLGRQNVSKTIVRQIQLMFPLTDRDQLAVFALSTQCLRDWDDYVDLMASICRTIRWSAPEARSSISSALDNL